MKRHTALDQAIHLMESDLYLALNSGKLHGLRPDGHTPGLYWYRGPAERLTLPVDNYVHIIYRDLNQKVQVSEGFYGYAPLRQVIPEHPLNHLLTSNPCFLPHRHRATVVLSYPSTRS